MSARVLITGARAPVAIDLARAFDAAGDDVHLADSVTPWAARWSKAGRVHRLPPPRQQFVAFAEALARWVDEYAPTLILPTCEEVFYVAAAAERHGFAPLVFAPPLAVLRRLHSKIDFPALARASGVAAPETWRIASRADLDALPLPPDRLVLKPEFSRFATATLVCPDDAALRRFSPCPGQVWAAQAYIPGEEICLWSAAIDGRIIACAPYRPVWRHGRAAAYAFEPVECPAAVEVARRIAAATRMTGHLSFDLILTAQGEAIPIECNPRAVSGVHLFGDRAGLAQAIAGGGAAVAPTSGLRFLSPAMALLAPFSGRFGDLARDWRRGRDVLGIVGDRLPAFGALIDAARFAATGFSRRRGAAGQSTDDIEWNGEPLA